MNQFEKLLKHFLNLKHDQNFYLELQSRPLDYLDEDLAIMLEEASPYDIMHHASPEAMRMQLRSNILSYVADSII